MTDGEFIEAMTFSDTVEQQAARIAELEAQLAAAQGLVAAMQQIEALVDEIGTDAAVLRKALRIAAAALDAAQKGSAPASDGEQEGAA